ncbi:MAG: hypothetical protein V7641_3052 [Blastocatellia bacterium]
MKRGNTRNAARLGVILIALTLLGGTLVSSPQAAQPWKVASVDMAGADGANNNMAFAYDRFILVAPYAPTKMPADPAAVEALDNYNIYVLDSKKPLESVKSHPIEMLSGEANRLYYPTKLIYDENSQTVYVRGTRFVKVEGGVQEIATIAHIPLNLDDNGKPVFDDNIVMVDIAGVGDEKTIDSDAPDDFDLAYNGKILVFTNGASIFTYNVDHGYLYHVEIVKPEAYNAGGRITYLDVDAASNTLAVYWNSKSGEGDKARNETELSFYRLDGDGTMQLKKRLYRENFPEGVSMTAGSNLEVLAKYDEAGKFAQGSFALAVTSDGNVCQIDLTGDDVAAQLKPLFRFDSLAASSDVDGSPRMLKYDATKRTIGIVRQGYTAQIRKPINDRRGKPGSIIRTLSLFNALEPPMLAVARLSKNLSKVIASKVFVDEFRDEAGLTRLIDGQDSQWMLATHSGKVLALSTVDTIDATELNLLTLVGPRTGRIAYFTSRDSIVTISSFALDATQEQIGEAGALVVARRTANSAQSYSVTSAATVSAGHAASAQGPRPSIRRPCNIDKR